MAGTVIGSSLVVEGEIKGDDELVVLGTVKGSIAVKQSVVIDSGAVVEADIATTSATVGGQLKGSVAASERIELKPDGRMVGNIRSPRIHIAEGATFKGNVDMEG